MRRFLTVFLYLAAGCDTATEPSTAVVNQAPEARQADALLLEIAVVVEGDAPLTLAPEHITEVVLEVDGAPWGRFELDAQPPEGDAVRGPWRLIEEPRGALLVARLDRDADTTHTPPETVAAWLDVLDRTLEPGAHAARVAAITLRGTDGTQLVLQSPTWVPFDVALGAGSAWLGALTFTTTLAGEP